VAGRVRVAGETFEGFVAARGPALLRLAVMLTGDAHAAQDLVQTALARALRHWAKVEAADAPEAYVRRIVLHEHLSWRRRRSNGEVVSDAAVAARSPSGVDPAGGDPAGPTVARDAAWRLLATLPRRQRAVLVLRYYDDLDDAAIAGLLGCGQSTVRSQAARGLAALRAAVPTMDAEALP
jgi:RNA polymerase sigma-70 factor (sigma-E family)